jgi:hypothetical protein
MPLENFAFDFLRTMQSFGKMKLSGKYVYSKRSKAGVHPIKSIALVVQFLSALNDCISFIT